MNDFGLLAQEFSEAFNVTEILRITNSTASLCWNGVFDWVHTQMLQRLVGVAAKLNALIKVLRPLIVKIDRRDKRNQ